MLYVSPTAANLNGATVEIKNQMKVVKKSLGPVTTTPRGFEIIQFKDRDGDACKLQVSSLADYEKPGISALILGLIKAEPKVMAQDAHKLGMVTVEDVGWIDYPVPEEVLISTTVHLDREQVEALIHHLQAWLMHDTLKLNGK